MRLRTYLDEERLLDRGRDFLSMLNLPESPQELTINAGMRGDFSQYATFAIDPPNDVRMALLQEAGIAAHWRTLHEFGHAAQALLAPSTGPLVLRRILCPAVSEGCAKAAERFVYAPEWLEANHVPRAEIDSLLNWEPHRSGPG